MTISITYMYNIYLVNSFWQYKKMHLTEGKAPYETCVFYYKCMFLSNNIQIFYFKMAIQVHLYNSKY